MRKAMIADIRKRLQGLQSTSETISSSSKAFTEGALATAESGRASDIKRVIESGIRSKYNIPFSTYLELFDALAKVGTNSDIEKIGSIFVETLVHKPRDAKAMQIVLKQRMTRMKSKLKSYEPERAQNKFEDSLPKPVVSTTVENTMLEFYQAMLDKAVIYEHCDRVIDNYNKISKRFNLDLLFYENSRINGVRDTVIELCKKIDTYNIPIDIRFNTVIETALYGFDRNSVECTKSEILEAAIDFFLFKSKGKEACRSILETTVFFDKNDDMKNIDIIMEDEPDNDDEIKINNHNDIVREYFVSKYLNNDKVVYSESSDFNEIFKKFKQEELEDNDKPEGKLRSLIDKLYSKNVDSIIDGTPDLLSWIRIFFIIGTGTVPIIGPILLIVGLIADRFIALGMGRKETEKMVKCFSNEIKKSKEKLNTIEGYEDKDRLNKYIDSLEKAKSKIEDYQNSLLTDDEISEKYDSMNFDDLDFDIDMDFDNDDELDGLFETSIAEIQNKIYILAEELSKMATENCIDKIDMYDVASKASDDDLIAIATIAAKYPETFFVNDYNRGLEDHLSDIRKNKINFDSSISKIFRTNAIQSAKEIINADRIDNNKSTSATVYESYRELSIIVEAYSAIKLILDSKLENVQFLEASISNRLKMASMKLKNAFTKLSDKDRQLSKSIDVGLNNVSKGVERALTNDNRESIIKGSILPSASKIIKLGIVNAGLLAIGQPVLAIIATLGYLGVSAKFKAKERQMLTDEIEIELKMCQKYIEIAEQKNDMKALKQLMMIQRDLERQHQRIKYKMKADLGQKYYDAKHVDD